MAQTNVAFISSSVHTHSLSLCPRSSRRERKKQMDIAPFCLQHDATRCSPISFQPRLLLKTVINGIIAAGCSRLNEDEAYRKDPSSSITLIVLFSSSSVTVYKETDTRQNHSHLFGHLSLHFLIVPTPLARLLGFICSSLSSPSPLNTTNLIVTLTISRCHIHLLNSTRSSFHNHGRIVDGDRQPNQL